MTIGDFRNLIKGLSDDTEVLVAKEQGKADPCVALRYTTDEGKLYFAPKDTSKHLVTHIVVFPQ